MIIPWHNFSFFLSATELGKPAVAISACLTGEAVRYDGRDNLLETTSTLLSSHLNLLTICPEVGAGLSVPRPPVQLVRTQKGIEVIGRDDKTLNVTAALSAFRQQSLEQVDKQLCGYIFKSRSPSCGLNSSPVFNQQGQPIGLSSGVQASYFQQQMPWLVFAEETQLQSEQQCQQFIMRCLITQDIQKGSEQTSLIAVHRHYQFLIEPLDKQLRNLLDEAANTQPQHYLQRLFEAL